MAHLVFIIIRKPPLETCGHIFLDVCGVLGLLECLSLLAVSQRSHQVVQGVFIRVKSFMHYFKTVLSVIILTIIKHCWVMDTKDKATDPD